MECMDKIFSPSFNSACVLGPNLDWLVVYGARSRLHFMDVFQPDYFQ